MVPFLLANTDLHTTTRTHIRMRARGIVSPFFWTFPSLRGGWDYETPERSFLCFLNTNCAMISGVRAMHAMSSAHLGDAPLNLQIHIPAYTLPRWIQFLVGPGKYHLTTHYREEHLQELRMWGGLARSVGVFEGLRLNKGTLSFSFSRICIVNGMIGLTITIVESATLYAAASVFNQYSSALHCWWTRTHVFAAYPRYIPDKKMLLNANAHDDRTYRMYPIFEQQKLACEGEYVFIYFTLIIHILHRARILGAHTHAQELAGPLFLSHLLRAQTSVYNWRKGYELLFCLFAFWSSNPWWCKLPARRFHLPRWRISRLLLRIHPGDHHAERISNAGRNPRGDRYRWPYRERSSILRWLVNLTWYIAYNMYIPVTMYNGKYSAYNICWLVLDIS